MAQPRATRHEGAIRLRHPRPRHRPVRHRNPSPAGLLAPSRPERTPPPRRGRAIEDGRTQADPRLGHLPDRRRPRPRSPTPRSSDRPGARGVVGRPRRSDHRRGLRTAPGLNRNVDRRSQRPDRLRHPRGVDPHGHGRRGPGEDTRPRTRPCALASAQEQQQLVRSGARRLPAPRRRRGRSRVRGPNPYLDRAGRVGFGWRLTFEAKAGRR